MLSDWNGKRTQNSKLLHFVENCNIYALVDSTLHLYFTFIFFVYISFIFLNRKDLDNCRTSRVKLRVFLSKIAIFWAHV